VNGELTQIVVGIGYNDNCHPYEVWGINANQQIFRYNYCTAAFANTPGYLVRISAGGGDVWGVNAAGLVFRYDFYSQTWVQIAGSLQQIAVGSNAVWGLDKTVTPTITKTPAALSRCPAPKRTLKSQLGEMESGESIQRTPAAISSASTLAS